MSTNHTLTRTDICDTLSEKVGLPRHISMSVLETTIDEITRGLIRDKSVKISSFGTFHVREKNERVGRNPKTGQEVPISRRNSLSFRASQILKDSVNK
ncbi:MAG: integration host factor subunit alpha [Alphaproteobacteria bacterium]